jgi:hypothetical protein
MIRDGNVTSIGSEQLDPRRCGELRGPQPHLFPDRRNDAAHWHNRLLVSVRFDRREDWVRNIVCGDAVRRQPRARSLAARGLRKVTVIVPEDCVVGLSAVRR